MRHLCRLGAIVEDFSYICEGVKPLEQPTTMRQTFIRGLLATLFLLTSLTAMSQVHIYQGAYAYSNETLYTLDGAVPVPILVVGLQL